MSWVPPKPAVWQLHMEPDWDSIQRALFVRLRSIGDTILMTPALEALKAWRPDLHVTVVSEPLSAPLLENHPLVDELIVTGASFISRLRLISALRRRNFHIAYNMHGGSTATLITALSGSKITVGYRGHRYSSILDLRAPGPDEILGRESIHSVEQQLALLYWTGVPWPESRPALGLHVDGDALLSAKSRLSAAGFKPETGGRVSFAIIAPAAAFESKQWPLAGFVAVAKHIRETYGFPSIMIAGSGQEAIASEAASASSCGATAITGLSLKELAALISMARLYVGNDSGPMHIAAALRRPLVAIFGPSNSSVWYPWTDSIHKVLRASDFPVSADDGIVSSAPGISALMARIPIGAVISAVDDVINSSKACDSAPAG